MTPATTTTIDLRPHIQRAIRDEWPAFAREHPRLAAILDESLLIDQAAARLADDPDYRAAMDAAASIGAGAEAVATVIRGLVTRWLRELV